MSANVAPMSPMQSTTIKVLLWVGLAQLCPQLVLLLSQPTFDWRFLAITVITIAGGIFARMAGSDIQAPPVLGFLNRSNVSAVSPAATRDAEKRQG